MMRTTCTAAGLVALLTLLVACGGGSGGGGESDCPAPAFTNLTGVWNVDEVQTGNGCPSSNPQYRVTFTQTGTEILVLGRTTFTMTICGSRASATINPTVPGPNGLRRYRNLVLSFSSDSRFTGTAQWTLESGSSTCDGTSTFAGIR